METVSVSCLASPCHGKSTSKYLTTFSSIMSCTFLSDVGWTRRDCPRRNPDRADVPETINIRNTQAQFDTHNTDVALAVDEYEFR